MTSRGEYVAAAILVVLGAVFAVSSLDYGIFGEGARIGPGFLPSIVGVLLVVFGSAIALQTRRERSGAAAPGDGDASHPVRAEEVMPPGEGDSGTFGSVVLILALLGAAVFLSQYIGFLVAFTLMVFAILTAVEREKAWFSLLIAIGIGVVAWLVFEAFMGIGLPAGVLGFPGS